jgi:3-oxoacyl-[acyl-carrier-protein] synthase-3
MAALPRCDWSYFESECTHCSGGLRRASRRRERGGDPGAGTAQGGDHTGVAESVGPAKSPGNLGLSRVRVCGSQQPYDLVLKAATAAIDEAGIAAGDIDLILDSSTFPGENSQSISFAHRLSAELGAESSMNLSFRAGGCGALHLAIKTALGWMSMDERIQTALLVTGDAAPAHNRSLLPITVQGDAASAVLLRRQGTQGPLLLGVEAMTLSHLHKAILLTKNDGHIQLNVDAAMIEHKVMPIFYLHLFRLANKVLADAGLRLSDVDHFIYSNISRRDREGFRKMVGLPEEGCRAPAWPSLATLSPAIWSSTMRRCAAKDSFVPVSCCCLPRRASALPGG